VTGTFNALGVDGAAASPYDTGLKGEDRDDQFSVLTVIDLKERKMLQEWQGEHIQGKGQACRVHLISFNCFTPQCTTSSK
jgi:hypothetical protein